MVLYRERLWPSAPGWLLAPAFGFACALACYPFGSKVMIAAASIATVACLVFLVAHSPVLTVKGGTFRAGWAQIETCFLRGGEVVTATERHRALGHDLHPHAFVLLRAASKEMVRIEVSDPADPTPYWLVSSRHPHKLLAALAG